MKELLKEMFEHLDGQGTLTEFEQSWVDRVEFLFEQQ